MVSHDGWSDNTPEPRCVRTIRELDFWQVETYGPAPTNHGHRIDEVVASIPSGLVAEGVDGKLAVDRRGAADALDVSDDLSTGGAGSLVAGAFVAVVEEAVVESVAGVGRAVVDGCVAEGDDRLRVALHHQMLASLSGSR